MNPYPPDWRINDDGSISTPEYPPYVPESQFDASGPMPRSTLDGIHGTRGDEPQRWEPSYPGELPPYWTKDYVQDQGDPSLWWPDTRPSPPDQTHPAAYDGDKENAEQSPEPSGSGGDKLNVNPADLYKAADDYAELQARAAALGPQAVEEVNRIIATHGAMGYPVAVGIVAGLARREAQVAAKAAQFGQYSQRFTEHAATYIGEDAEGAGRYGTAGFESTV